MKRTIIALLFLCSTLAVAGSGLTAKDLKLAQEAEKKDFVLLKHFAKADRELVKIEKVKALISGKRDLRRPNCDDDIPSGSESCWDKCSADGYSTSYCASMCGTDSTGGSQGCWEACAEDGYSTSYCASQCGTDTSGGSQSCWDACSEDGYSTSYCASQCGTDTPGGSAGCWEACAEDGYSTSYCASQCGTK